MKFKILLAAFILALSTNSFGSTDKENIYLLQTLNQLEAVKKTVECASKERPNNIRKKFHYNFYQDQDGKKHNGLINDIDEIILSIKQKISEDVIDPKSFDDMDNNLLK